MGSASDGFKWVGYEQLLCILSEEKLIFVRASTFWLHTST